MLLSLSEFASLPASDLMILIAVAFAAGLVRGFAGFALSALIMAGSVLVLPPIELIPVCYILEGVASLLMVRGGARDADFGVVFGLVAGALIGMPIGLLATRVMDHDGSRLAALVLLLGLTVLQLFRISHPILATRAGLFGTGIAAGFASGIASIGGMVVALYVLARGGAVRQMRASLVIYLFVGMFTTLVYLFVFDVMTATALSRGIVLAVPVAVGVMLGTFLFRPALEGIYKRFCLIILALLSLNGLWNLG